MNRLIDPVVEIFVVGTDLPASDSDGDGMSDRDQYDPEYDLADDVPQ
jgi:hypothetical protein